MVIAAYSPKPKLRRDGWTKSLQIFVKLNVDASFDADVLRGTTGAVILIVTETLLQRVIAS
jgi:hypothetical protein